MNKLVRITTVPRSLEKLLGGQLAFMKKNYEVIAVSSDKEHLNRIGKKEAIRTFHVEMTRQITPLKDLKSLWRLYFFLRKEKPLIVHTHTPKAGTIGMIASKLSGIPIRLHTVAGLPLLESTGAKRKLLNLVEKITYFCATNVYPNSSVLKTIIEDEKLCPSKKLKVIANGSSNGIDTSFFSPDHFSEQEKQNLRHKWNIKESDFVFVFVGRLVKDKGINELIKAFDTLTHKYPQIKLLLVGNTEPELDPLLLETQNTINSNKAIIPTDFQSDVRPFLAISNALVFPSYREGFPNVVMQAGSMGLPSIVTDINGCNEIIIEGVNGTIIPSKNVEELMKKMEIFITEPDLIANLASESRKSIISRYEQSEVWDAILKEYKSRIKK